jgi:hypothetical protein
MGERVAVGVIFVTLIHRARFANVPSLAIVRLAAHRHDDRARAK